MNKKYIFIVTIIIVIALFVGIAYFWSLTGQEGIKNIATLPDSAVEFYAGPYLKSFAYKIKNQEGYSIVYNGEIGKIYDDIGSFTFSPDGKNFAYIAEIDSADKTTYQNVVVINGKEGKRYNKISELNADANGNFSYYVGGDDKYSNKIQVINKDESHLNASFFNYTKSPNGRSFAYQIREKDKRHVVYVDKNGIEHQGKDYLDTISFTWSPSGDHFAYIAYAENGKTYIVVDGVEQGPYEDPYRYLFKWNLNENGFAYRLDSDKAGRIVVLNGKEVGRFGESDGVSDLVVSPDGESVIYSVHKQNESSSNIFVNETKSPLQYDNFSGFVYSPDSKTIAYAIQEGGTVVIRKGNEELGRYQTQTRVDYGNKFPILFSKDWKNFAYPIVRVSTTTKQILIGGIATTSVVALRDFTVSINGQEGDAYGVVYLTENSFSEDGKTFTYLAISHKNEIFRVINHVGHQ